MIAGEILRTVLNYDIPNASAAKNSFTHEYIGAGAPDADIVNSMNAWFINEWAPLWTQLGSSVCEMDNFVCDVLNPDGTVLRNLGGLGLNIAGADPNAYGGAAISSFLLAYTPFPKQRGSKYVPAISEAQYDNNVFNAGAILDMVALLAVYLAPTEVAGSPDLIAGLLSRPLLQFVEFIGNGLVDAQPAYQRRRKEGVGI